MTTNFFQHIDAFIDNKLIHITICKEDDKMIVSTMITEKGTLLPSVQCTGTAEQLDNGYFEGIKSPVSEVKELFLNTKSFKKGLESSKKTLSTDTPKAVTKAVSTIDAVDTVQEKVDYSNILKRINELNGLCKYDEALSLVPKIEDFPDKKIEIEKLRKDLQWRSSQLLLI